MSQCGLKSPSSSDKKTSTVALVKALANGSTLAEATATLVQGISAKISEILNIPLADIDVDLPLSRYGVDSLVAMELRNWLNGGAKAKVTVFEVLQSASLSEFGALVAAKSEDLLERKWKE